MRTSCPVPTFAPAVAVVAAVAAAFACFSAAALEGRDGRLEAAGQALVEDALAGGVRTVVIYDLADAAGRSNALGRRLADELARVMVDVDRNLSICDRDATERILEEHRFQLSGMVDRGEARLQQLGRLCGPGALVHGTVEEEGGRLRVRVRISSLPEGELLGSETWSLPAEPHLLDLLQRIPRDSGLPAADPGGRDEPASPELEALRETVEMDDALHPLGGDLPEEGYFELDLASRSGPFHFHLHHCVFRQSDYLKCVLTVRNERHRERELRVRGSDTILFDTAGTPYPVQLLTVGGEDFVSPRGGEVVSRPVRPGESVQLELIFNGVPRVKKKGQTLTLVLDGLEPVHFVDFFFAREPRG